MGGAVAVILLGGGAAQAVDLSRNAPPLFGAVSVESTDLSQFYKWTGVLAAFRAERERMYRDCLPGESCKLQQWRSFIDSLRGRDPMTRSPRPMPA